MVLKKGKPCLAMAAALTAAMVLTSCAGGNSSSSRTETTVNASAVEAGRRIAEELKASVEETGTTSPVPGETEEPGEYAPQEALSDPDAAADDDFDPDMIDGDEAAAAGSVNMEEANRLTGIALALAGTGVNLLGTDPSTGFSNESYICWCLHDAGIMDLKVAPPYILKTRCLATSEDTYLPGDLVFLGHDYYMPTSVGIMTSSGRMAICGASGVKEMNVDDWPEPVTCYGRVCSYKVPVTEPVTVAEPATKAPAAVTTVPATTVPAPRREPDDSYDLDEDNDDNVAIPVETVWQEPEPTQDPDNAAGDDGNDQIPDDIVWEEVWN